jgi:hypothetical protein
MTDVWRSLAAAALTITAAQVERAHAEEGHDANALVDRQAALLREYLGSGRHKGRW